MSSSCTRSVCIKRTRGLCGTRMVSVQCFSNWCLRATGLVTSPCINMMTCILPGLRTQKLIPSSSRPYFLTQTCRVASMQLLSRDCKWTLANGYQFSDPGHSHYAVPIRGNGAERRGVSFHLQLACYQVFLRTQVTSSTEEWRCQLSRAFASNVFFSSFPQRSFVL